MSDDAMLTMLEAVADRLDQLEAQANMHAEAMTQIAEIALLAYAASSAEEPLPEALRTSAIIEEAICRHPERLEGMQRSAYPRVVRAHLRIAEAVIAKAGLSKGDMADALAQLRTELMARVARGEAIREPQIRGKPPTPAQHVDRER